MSGDKENNPPRARRASLVELFASRPNIESSATASNQLRPQASSMASAVTQQAQQQQQSGRRLSITTLGLSGSSAGQPASAFRTVRRGASVSDKPPLSENESAIADDELMKSGVDGSSPKGRRMSFGARAAYKDRSSNGGGGSAVVSPPAIAASKSISPGSATKEPGFNWSDNLKQRAQRSSISAATASSPGSMMSHSHTTSAASSQPAPAARISSPKPPPPKAPDHFQERILRGDFYMD